MFPLDKGFLDLLLEEARLDSVDDLRESVWAVLTLKRKRRLSTLLDSLAGGSGR